MSPELESALLIFQFGGKLVALSLDDVDRVLPMADLARPPALPSPLEGMLNLAGVVVPVLRLDRLFQLPEQPLGLYSMLIVLKGGADERLALLVDRVHEILAVPNRALLPMNMEDSFNGCAEAAVCVREQLIPLLSSPRLLLQKERKSLSSLQQTEQKRLGNWGLLP